MIDDRFEVSLRFRLTIEAKILQLEEGAILDAHSLVDLACEDQRRRHRRLVQAQLDRAGVLRELLASTRVRTLSPA